MDVDQWERAREVFQAILERPSDEREELLSRLCGDDALRGEVEALLDGHRRAGGFLDQPAVVPAAAGSPESADLLAGREIGAYRIVRRIGQGGMGAVYLAVRSDEEYRKRVALKVLRPGMDTDDVIRRFRAERQILAGLDHPNIARLLDGGSTGDGLPYLVMEYVEGRPIDEYCDRRRLDIRTRLELFCKVCSAVEFAHRNLVVHRDLKPSNILVSSDGVPKLLDFGIAKLLNPELASQQLAPTATLLRMMTPDYASPEQVRGETVTTAADVYSLGVLLYYLLTGHRPYRIENRSPVEILRVICEQEPTSPSTAVLQEETIPGPDGGTTTVTPETVSQARDGGPARLHRRLAGDLDNIVLKALRKEPERRYLSVEQLAEDIRRHLDGRPILARKDTLAYRCGKFLRRHRLGVAAAAAFVMACLAFGITMGLQRAKLAEERDRAEKVKDFLLELLQFSDPLKASSEPPELRDFLDVGAMRLEDEFASQPELKAELLEPIGVLYRRLGELDGALPLLQEAVEIRREISGEGHLELAGSIQHLGDLRLARGEFEEAQALFEQALDLRRRELGDRHPEIAESLNGLGKVFHYLGDLEDAKVKYRQALEMRRDFLGPQHVEIAESLNNLAAVLFYLGQTEESEKLHREALGMREDLLGQDHIEVSESLNSLSVVLRERGALAEARPLAERALEVRRKYLGDEHPRVATSLHNLAAIQQETGTLEEAQANYGRAIEIYRKKLDARHPHLAGSRIGLASVREQQGETDDAERLYRQAIDVLRDTGATRQKLAIALNGLAALQESRGEFAVASALLDESANILESVYPAGHWRIAEAESILGGVLIGSGRFTEAEPLLVRSDAILASTPGESARFRRRSGLQHLAELYEASGSR